MPLWIRFGVIFAVVLALVTGLGYGIQRLYIRAELMPIEDAAAQESMGRCLSNIQKNIAHLDARCAKWAAEPRLLAALQGGNPEQVQAFFEELAPQHTDIDVFLAFDAQGNVLSQHVLAKSPSASAARDNGDLALTQAVLDIAETRGRFTGVLRIGGTPVILAGRPVMSEAATPAMVGFFAMGHTLDQAMANHGGGETALYVYTRLVTNPALSAQDRAALDAIAQGRSPYVTSLGSGVRRVYAALAGLDGTPAVLLFADVSGGAAHQVSTSMRQGLLIQLIVGVGALLVLLAFFHRSLAKPLQGLAKHAASIRQTNDLSARLDLQRTDEIGELSRELDHMVERLEDDAETRRQAKEALRESEQRYAVALKGANDGIWDWDLQTDKVHFSPRWKSMLGYAEEEIGDEMDEWVRRIHKEERAAFQAALESHLKGQSEHLEQEVRIQHKDGHYLWALCRGCAVRDENGDAIRIAGSQTDITARKKAEERLTHDAMHDTLTGLANRVLFLDRLALASKRLARKKNYVFAVLFLDLDRFKVINDGLGHAVGDGLLREVARRLTSSLRVTDTIGRCRGTIARFGGDEFVVLLDDIYDVTDAIRVAERIQGVLAQPYNVEDHEIFTSASIGISIGHEDLADPEELLRNADTALYRAKAEGRACYTVFDTEMGAEAQKRLQLETALRRAIEREEFAVHYHPIVSLETGRIVSFEALIRWHHPELGLVAPSDFILVAEETGMIVPIGRWLIRNACQQTRAWQTMFPHTKDLHLNVNLSSKEIAQPDVVDALNTIVSETGLDPSCLMIEITESTLMRHVHLVTETLANVRDIGIRLAIDDFGTGYSSLSYLNQFPVDILKIDFSFVREMHVAPESLQLVKAILTLAQNLGLSVIAEGIENNEQLERLRSLDCQTGQGHLFSKPADADTITALLATDPSW